MGESGEQKAGKAPESRALWARKSGLPSLMAGYWHIYEALSYLLFYIFTFFPVLFSDRVLQMILFLLFPVLAFICQLFSLQPSNKDIFLTVHINVRVSQTSWEPFSLCIRGSDSDLQKAACCPKYVATQRLGHWSGHPGHWLTLGIFYGNQIYSLNPRTVLRP